MWRSNIAIANAGNYRITLFLDKPDHTYSIELTSFDKRALFVTEGQSLDIDDIAQFSNGYAVAKWRNVTSTGQQGSHPVHVDTDFPMFRLADVYLMYAEAVLRGGGRWIHEGIAHLMQGMTIMLLQLFLLTLLLFLVLFNQFYITRAISIGKLTVFLVIRYLIIIFRFLI